MRSVAGAERAARLDELLLPDRQRVAADDACDVRPAEERDHEDHEAEAGLRRGPPRHPVFDVPQAATMPIAKRSTGIARRMSMLREMIVSAKPRKKPAMMPTTRADQHGDARRDEGDEQRRARSVEHPHEDVSAGLVGAEPERRVRPLRQAELVEHLRPGRARSARGRRRCFAITPAKIASRTRTMMNDEAPESAPCPS